VRKLSDEQVCEIRSKYVAKGTLYRVLAKEYGVSYGLIGKIVRREQRR
jgi:transposase